MKSLLRWKPELRDDGVWGPVTPYLLVLLWPLAWGASFIYKNPGDPWRLGIALVFLIAGIWWFGFVRWGFGDRLLFGISQKANRESALVVGRHRIPISSIERLVVHGPLARRDIMVHPKTGWPFALDNYGDTKLRAMAEQYLVAHRRELPFAVEFGEPESPFLQPNTLL